MSDGTSDLDGTAEGNNVSDGVSEREGVSEGNDVRDGISLFEGNGDGGVVDGLFVGPELDGFSEGKMVREG